MTNDLDFFGSNFDPSKWGQSGVMYPGGSSSFDESAAGRGYEVPITPAQPQIAPPSNTSPTRQAPQTGGFAYYPPQPAGTQSSYLPTNQPGGVTSVNDPAQQRRAGIRQAYLQYLGREPQESDYMSWVGNNNFMTEIQNSPEARARAAGQTYQKSYNPVGGFMQDKLNDPNHNSPKYQMGRAMQDFSGQYGRGNLQPLVDYYNAKFGGNARVMGEDLIDMGIPGWGPIDIIKGGAQDELQWLPYSPGLPGGGGMTGRSPYPNPPGIQTFAGGGGAYGDPSGPSIPGGDPNYSGQGGGPTGMGPSGDVGFNDPAYNQLSTLVTARLRQLGVAAPEQMAQQYMTALKGQQEQSKQRAQTFADQLTARVKQLQQPLLSQADVANQNALASNDLIAQRDAALANAREKRFASGFGPTSGLLAGDERQINEDYQNRQAQIDARLRGRQIEGDENRRDTATRLQQVAAQALQGGDLQSLQTAAQMADLENQLFMNREARNREALGVGQIPVDLTNMAFSNSLNAANTAPNPLGMMMALIGMGQNQQYMNQGQSNSTQAGLANLINMLFGGQ